MLRVFIVSFLFLFVSVSASADICSFCKTSGCLIDYQTAKSDKCRSCQICLRDKAPDKTDTENGDNDEGHAEQRVTIIDNSSILIGSPEKGETSQLVKDCADNEWKHEAACKDLKFQERMADSAEDIIGLTWWQLALSGVGLFFILRSLKAAQNANKIALKANGPFIDVIGAELNALQYDSFNLEIAVRNTGNSSASDLHFRGTMTIQHASDDQGQFGPNTPQPFVHHFESNYVSVAPKTINIVEEIFDGWSLIYDCLPDEGDDIYGITTFEFVPPCVTFEGVISHSFMGETSEQSICLDGHTVRRGARIVLQGTNIHPRAQHYQTDG